jgi:hypothetical protein
MRSLLGVALVIALGGVDMFKWMRTRHKATPSIAENADRLAKSSDQGETPSDPDPIEELVRIVGETHVVDAHPRRHARVWRRPARTAARIVGNRK